MSKSHYDPTHPKYEWGKSWTKNAVTEKQIAFINELATTGHLTITGDLSQISRGTASHLIDELKRHADGDTRSLSYLQNDYASLKITKQEG